MESPEGNLNPRGFILAVGLGLMWVALQPYVEGTYRPYVFWPVVTLGLACLILSWVWPRLGSSAWRTSVESATADFRWWFAVVTVVWLYAALTNVVTERRRADEIAALRNDVQSIATVIERGVLPRHLTKNQQATFAIFLTHFPKHEVAFKVIRGDAEAEAYRTDIHQALVKGGWKVISVDLAEDVQDGLRTEFAQTTADAQSNAPGNPNAELLLQMAFGLAGIKFDGSGGTNGATKTLLTLQIGHNRKDVYRQEPPLE